MSVGLVAAGKRFRFRAGVAAAGRNFLLQKDLSNQSSLILHEKHSLTGKYYCRLARCRLHLGIMSGEVYAFIQIFVQFCVQARNSGCMLEVATASLKFKLNAVLAAFLVCGCQLQAGFFRSILLRVSMRKSRFFESQ